MLEYKVSILILFALFQVHHGFYNAYHNTTIRPGILNAVARAKEFYGDIGIIVTGHSMGGAMASFCALDLRVIITKPVSFLLVSSLINFLVLVHFLFIL